MKITTYKDIYKEVTNRGYLSPFIREDNAENIGIEEARNALELDRRHVFLYWYGEKVADKFGVNRPMWYYRLEQAERDYMNGFVDCTMDYILSYEKALDQAVS